MQTGYRKGNSYRFGEHEGQKVVFIKASNADVEFIVDADSFKPVSNFTWFLSGRYAKTKGPKRKIVPLHWLIQGRAEGYVVDHINGDTLDNRKQNLRIVPCGVNNRNINAPTRSASGFRGVYRNGPGWRAQLGYRGKRHNLGTYETAKEAAAVVTVALAQIEAADEALFECATGKRFRDRGEKVL